VLAAKKFSQDTHIAPPFGLRRAMEIGNNEHKQSQLFRGRHGFA